MTAREKINIRSSRIFLGRRNRSFARGLSPGEVPQEKKMRILAVILGAAAAFAVAAPVAADPAIGGAKLAQAQDSGSQSGSSMGARQQGSSGASQKQGSSGMSQQGSSGMNRQGHARQRGRRNAASRETSGGGAAMGTQNRGSSRTTVRERSGGGRTAIHGGSHTTVGVGSRASNDVVVRRNRYRRHIYAEPSTTVIRKRRYVRGYHEPSSVIIHKRRPGVVIGGGTSTLTTVRGGNTVRSGSTTVRGGSSTTVGGGSNGRESVGAGAGGGRGS